VVVGAASKRQMVTNPQRTVFGVKRLIGRKAADKEVQSLATRLPYKIVAAKNGDAWVDIAGTPRSPQEVSAHVLAKMKRVAEDYLGQPVTEAVVTVPAYFDDAQRQATKDAGQLAGLEVLRLLNEPTAAAIAYGLENAAEGVYAVYDLGGGTFDLSILRLSRGVFEVIATSGDAALGGDDFDQRVFCWATDQAKLPPLGPRDMRQLLVKSREAKEYLTAHGEARITAKLTTHDVIDLALDTETFCGITQHLVQKTLGPVRKALRDAKLRPADVKGVVMVGGATRMPQIQRAVGEFFGREPLNNLDPDKVVALGAAMQAAALAGERPAGEDWLLLDVIPLSLGIETMGGLAERIVPRNSTIPVARAQEFTTYKDGQTGMSFHVVQGERELVADCRSLARFELKGIAPMAAGAARVRVSFQVDADGLLSVTAREATTGAEASVAVKPSYGLADGEIERMLRDSFDHARDDMHARALHEAQVEARRLLEAVRAALAADAALLEPAERAGIDARVTALEAVLTGTDHRALRSGAEALNRATEEFAARRMDAGVRRALAGRRIASLDL
ncbi:MAG: Fe-S protein assembly chaperone HscA, partial [Burkholderiales bacterium]